MSSTMAHFSPFANATFTLLSFLAAGLDGNGSWTITASKKGLTLKMGATIVARGKTPRELCYAFEAFTQQTEVEIARLKRELNYQEKAP